MLGFEYMLKDSMEFSNCGVGFLASLDNQAKLSNLSLALAALKNMEHRGGVGNDPLLGDGAGIMTSIPWELFEITEHEHAVASLFLPCEEKLKKLSLKIFEQCFEQYGLIIESYREVKVDTSVLSEAAVKIMPGFIHAIIKRPKHCRTKYSFEKLLYLAKQLTRIKEKENGVYQQFYFSSLSASSIVYKALCTSDQLENFFIDLQNDHFKIKFAIVHRRFSTNTLSSWDKVQPFRLIAHNGEINTIEGNRTQAISREKASGLRQDELITRTGVSDSGNMNGMVEALKYRSSIPLISEILAIMVPPASDKSYYHFWSRAMEPWDGPALINYCDGKYIGARLDRSGFRPCRWTKTKTTLFLASEAGVFPHNENVIQHGSLSAGESISVHLYSGKIITDDPSTIYEHDNFSFSNNLSLLEYIKESNDKIDLKKNYLYNFNFEDYKKIIDPMILNKKEPIGSMGYTASLAILSNQNRSLFDYFYQDFAQVTNPPLDYIREKLVTDLRVFLCRKPNIFESKELLPPKAGYLLETPVISLGQLEYVKSDSSKLKSLVLDTTFSKDFNFVEVSNEIENLTQKAIEAINDGVTIIILSDRKADDDHYPIPPLLVLRSVNLGLNRVGQRLKVSIIMDSGEVKTSHQVACLISFGASAVCPYMSLSYARNSEFKIVNNLFSYEKEERLIEALSDGVLKIMSKMGISVLRSYQGSQLFSILGLNDDVVETYFPNLNSTIGGLTLKGIVEFVKNSCSQKEIINIFEYSEQPKESHGEIHSISSRRSRIIHQLIKEDFPSKKGTKLFNDFKEYIDQNIVNLISLLKIKNAENKIEEIQSIDSIMETFGLGAMSFGAISAESQRDLIQAFKKVNGRSNSGEGGENPYYKIDGTSATIKQIASGRFGVTADYLSNAVEIQIKIVQGAKPGEGGQLLGAKVSKDIAKARFSNIGVDLISPAPQHDIYSIEDLKELIYELKEFNPKVKVSVKLVSGKNIGSIAVGVAKAGADIIHISGGDGGTGAASMTSMKSAGLPFFIGLSEVHSHLVKNNFRNKVILRTDGGIQAGKDIIVAAILGAEEFDLGKMMLISQGCIMARVCHKNTCPAGIATQNIKFKKRYHGEVKHAVNYLSYLAEDVRHILKEINVSNLSDLIGRTDLLENNEKFSSFINERNLNFDKLFHNAIFKRKELNNIFNNNPLNSKILSDIKNNVLTGEYLINSTDRAILAPVCAMRSNESAEKELNFSFSGCAGQGFAVFHSQGMNTYLYGQANDSFAKAISGGKVVITQKDSTLIPDQNSIIGNCALYGATGGKVFINGQAGDRFAIRNSGALSIVEGVGLHACEYMTNGAVIILGKCSGNIGAGMTGGSLYIYTLDFVDLLEKINTEYLQNVPLTIDDNVSIKNHLTEFKIETKNLKCHNILVNWNNEVKNIYKFIPL